MRLPLNFVFMFLTFIFGLLSSPKTHIRTRLVIQDLLHFEMDKSSKSRLIFTTKIDVIIEHI